jgi:hypothetical protein
MNKLKYIFAVLILSLGCSAVLTDYEQAPDTDSQAVDDTDSQQGDDTSMDTGASSDSDTASDTDLPVDTDLPSDSDSASDSDSTADTDMPVDTDLQLDTETDTGSICDDLVCDDGVVCNGQETCDDSLGCQSASDNAPVGTSCGSCVVCNGTGSCSDADSNCCTTSKASNFTGYCGSGVVRVLEDGCRYTLAKTRFTATSVSSQVISYECKGGSWSLFDDSIDGGPCPDCTAGYDDGWTDDCSGGSSHSLQCTTPL